METNMQRLSPLRSLGLPCRRAIGAALLVAVVWLRFPSEAADTPDITVKPGKQFQITLESNPTTGYQWRMAQPRLEPCVVLVTNQFVRPKAKLTGAPGREIWSFKAVKPGITTIQLEYVRSWEKGMAPARKTNVVVLVESAGTAK